MGRSILRESNELSWFPPCCGLVVTLQSWKGKTPIVYTGRSVDHRCKFFRSHSTPRLVLPNSSLVKGIREYSPLSWEAGGQWIISENMRSTRGGNVRICVCMQRPVHRQVQVFPFLRAPRFICRLGLTKNVKAASCCVRLLANNPVRIWLAPTSNP